MWARYIEQLSPEEAVAWADDEANVVSFEEMEVDWSRVPQTHRFVPLGFEAGGGVWAEDAGFSEGGGGGGGRSVVR